MFREHYEALTRLWTILAVVGSILGAGLAALGIYNILDLQKKRKALEEDVHKLNAMARQLVNEANRNHKVLMHTIRVQVRLELEDHGPPLKQDAIASLSENLSNAIRDYEPADDGIAAWAYSVDAFLKYRLGELSEAYMAGSRSIARQNEKNEYAYYNAACFAAQLRLFDESVEHLTKAIRASHHFRIDAQKDGDFDPIRGYPPFEKLVS